jgi:tetratricopeptide (TPR) repeat protein
MGKGVKTELIDSRANKNIFLVAHYVGCYGRRVPAGRLGSHEGSLFLPSRVSNPLSGDWQRHVLASSGYLELGMFDDAALVLEEIAPEDKNRNEVLGARVNLYMVAKKWDMAAAVAGHLVKVDPGAASWWISLAYAVRRTESVEKAEAILLRAQAIHPTVAMIAFNLACYASVSGRREEAKKRLRDAIALDKDIRRLAIEDEDLKPLWDWIRSLE